MAFLDYTGLARFKARLDEIFATKSDKTETVTNVSYDTTNKKIQKTINGTTSDVVTASTLKTDMALNNVENKSSATIRGEITAQNISTSLGYTPMNAALKGASNGVASLDSSAKVPIAQIPDIPTKMNVPTNAGTTGQILRKQSNGSHAWGDYALPSDFSDAVEDWMNDHISQNTTVALDDTLTQTAAAAQGKAAGDLIKIQNTQPTEATNKLWINNDINVQEIQVPTYDEFVTLNSALGIQDSRTNQLLGYINYGYDTPADLAAGSTASTAVAVKRNKTEVLLDSNESETTQAFVCKLNNDVQRAATSSQIKALTNGTVFTSGHTYRITVKKISGTATRNSSNIMPSVAVLLPNKNSTIGTVVTDTSTEYCREFTADSSEYKIGLRFEAGTTVNNLLVSVTMQDMADQSVFKLINDLQDKLSDTGLMVLTEAPYIQQGYIDSNGKWANRTSGNPRCAIIPVTAGQKINMKAGSVTTQIAALKSFSDPLDGTAADFSSENNWTSVIQVVTGDSFTGMVPSDATYLYVWLGKLSAGLTRKPEYFVVNGYDSMKTAIENIRDKADINSPAFTGSPTAVTPDADNDSTRIATTEFVKNIAFQLTHNVETIEDNTNIDELLTEGTFRITSSTHAATMRGDLPTVQAGYKLIVCRTIQTNNVYQFAMISSPLSPIKYRYYNGTTLWTKWKSLTTDFDTFENSKNLLPSKRKTGTINNVNFIYNDGLLLLNGTATGDDGKRIPITDYFDLDAGTYTFSLSYVNVKARGIFLRDTDDNDIVRVRNILEPQTITLSEPKTCYLGLNTFNGTQYDSEKIKIQIEKGSQQTYFVNPSIQTTVDQYAREYVDGILSAFTNIECVGDSLTYGAVYTTGDSYRQSHKPYPVVLGQITGANVSSLATPGVSATTWWNEYKNQITAKENALVIIFLGTNSGLQDSIDTDIVGNDPDQWANTTTGNYARIINAYQTAGYKVLLVKCFLPLDNLETTNDVIRQFADKFGCGIIENEYMNNISYHYSPDRTNANTLHYNDLGYAAFAHKIVENVSRMSEHYKSFIIPN